ncbi:hypothetical protein BDV96DRAFT_34127 [Lophiotrema nucula]|uniref:Uncharacterized protein n=1 Tax=Lophiotrema nucula TaxID=690887 RepID=A0A6A5ZC04_9PLEO|nr:hypothetical protein BDV96DRAFT_34127 [Lophiotrema nucula]
MREPHYHFSVYTFGSGFYDITTFCSSYYSRVLGSLNRSLKGHGAMLFVSSQRIPLSRCFGFWVDGLIWGAGVAFSRDLFHAFARQLSPTRPGFQVQLVNGNLSTSDIESQKGGSGTLTFRCNWSFSFSLLRRHMGGARLCSTAHVRLRHRGQKVKRKR